MIESVPGTLLRLAAFTTDPSGGNPAGVWFGERWPTEAEMQRTAAEVGYSETAFLAPDGSGVAGRFRVRYFSQVAEVPFCGHATIAAGVALAERGLGGDAGPDGRPGAITFVTSGGPVAVATEAGDDGAIRATLTSIATWVSEPARGLVAAALELLGWHAEELDPDLTPAVGYAGAKHLILVVRERRRLEHLDYPFDRLATLMREHDLTTLQLVWREAPDRFRARDPFPVGGLVEDPATGAAAAALGGYLRDRGVIAPPASFEIIQGVEMGRPSRITVSVVPGEAGVRVSGNAVPI